MSGRITGRDKSFYLEDVRVGQRFSTGSLELDEAFPDVGDVQSTAQ
jgi:hypothetical protein